MFQHRFLFTFAIIAMLVLAGCSGNRAAMSGPVFFPPAPNPPRVQYLTGVASSKDVETAQDKLSLFQVGAGEQKEVIPLVKPFGVAVHGTKVYLAEASGKIDIIDFVHKQFGTLKGDFGAGKLKKPTGLALDKEGNLFVADTQRKEVVMYDPDGNFVQAVGKNLNMKPVAVAVDGSFLYVLDIINSLVKVLDRKTGELVREIGKGIGKDDSLAVPIGMTLDSEGFLHITNALSGKIMKFDRDGHLVHSFGQLGDAFGEFGRPRGIETDREGITYVVDASHQNVQMFNEKGRLLMFFGDPGLPVGSLNLPADVVVGYEGIDYFQKLADPSFKLEKIIFVTNQYGNAKLAIYGFGHKKTDEELKAEREQKEKQKEKGEKK